MSQAWYEHDDLSPHHHWSTGWENSSSLLQANPIQLYNSYSAPANTNTCCPASTASPALGEERESQRASKSLVRLRHHAGADTGKSWKIPLPPSTTNATVAHLFHCCLAAVLFFEIILIVTSGLHTMQCRTWILVMKVPSHKCSGQKTRSFIFLPDSTKHKMLVSEVLQLVKFSWGAFYGQCLLYARSFTKGGYSLLNKDSPTS